METLPSFKDLGRMPDEHELVYVFSLLSDTGGIDWCVLWLQRIGFILGVTALGVVLLVLLITEGIVPWLVRRSVKRKRP